ncbi:Sensor protein [Oleispira antarctica RB-8]|uniref:histidine kinase n=1 Tax=Oleispira antarctica RB-8 TaxID=698738 RepID=R4YPB9_OLEAN|nr:Sensor protein [Oleispira antarctica RB-8]
MFDWIITPFTIYSNSILIYGTYNYWMVGLSIFIAILASFMGLQVAFQTKDSASPKRKQTMLLVGSIALGGGIWTMHFIGMLAFDLCTTVDYGWGLTLLSLIPGIAASWVALNHINSHERGRISLLMGGILMGSGIGTMHYTGMAAMEMAPLLRYDLRMFALSIVVAVSLAILALWIRFGLISLWKTGYSEWQANLAASTVMGCAISGMHYTGMAAARFVKPPGFELSQQTAETSQQLALGVSAATIVIIFLVLGINLIYRYKDISLRALESERQLKATLDTAVDGIITIDRHGTVINVNQATERLLGWSETELIGSNVNILVPRPLRAKYEDFLANYILTGKARMTGNGQEVQALHKNGDEVDIRLGVGHVKIAKNDFFVAFIADIRQRLKMESALHENEEKLRSLISNIPGIAFRCMNDKDWSMIFISDAVETISGYPAADFTLPNPKRSFAELYHPDDREKIYNTLLDKGSYSLEYRIIRRDGEIRWLMEYGTYIQEEKTEEVWLDGFIMDITERYKMVQQLRLAKDKAEQAASSRATFLANMSHEIRTPMNAIIGFSDILLDSELESEQLRHLKTINHSAKSLLHLLNDVLDSAKLDKGKLELEVRDFSLLQEVDAVISTLWLQAKSKGLALSTEVSPKLEERYSGSPERIRQVLTNLVSNSIKFTQHGSVKVSVKPTNTGCIEFLIEDTGIGMSTEQLKSVFDPFTQADASMSRRFGGTGLGTTISKQLVELMGGKISAKSELAKGSQFQFFIPLGPANNDTVEQLKTVQLPPMTILIVDDIQQNIDLLTVLLSRDGHTLLTARDGQQALIRMATESNIDLVLMDVQMPVMDGLTAASERRKVEQNKGLGHTPIIALTASVLEDDRMAAQAAGMDGFANKPIDFQFLCHEIARVLNICLLNIAERNPETEVKDITLIDEKKGIALWGSGDEYYRQLSYFVKQRQADFIALKNNFDNNEWQQFKNTVHKLKGICGNLSLTKLLHNLEALESELNQQRQTQSHSQNNKTKHCYEKIEKIQNTFNQVKNKVSDIRKTNFPLSESTIISLNTSLEAEGLNHGSLESADINTLNTLKDILQKLKQEAIHNEISDAFLTQLLNINNTPFSIDIDQIYEVLNDFEFSQAELLIDALLLKIAEYTDNSPTEDINDHAR